MLAAPREEPARPARSLTPASTGAAVSVLIVTASGDRPRRRMFLPLQDAPRHPGRAGAGRMGITTAGKPVLVGLDAAGNEGNDATVRRRAAIVMASIAAAGCRRRRARTQLAPPGQIVGRGQPSQVGDMRVSYGGEVGDVEPGKRPGQVAQDGGVDQEHHGVSDAVLSAQPE